jgi:hypothetical protein
MLPNAISRDPAVSPEAPRPRVSALSARGLAVGVVSVVITCFVVCYAELVVGNIQVGFLQLPPVVIGMLVLLLAGQGVLKRISARFSLKPHEFYTIYIMMLLASMLSSRGLLEKLIPLLVVPNYFATDSNSWKKLFGPHIPRSIVPFNPDGDPKQWVSQRFFDSLRAGEHIPWSLWLHPLMIWAVFVALIFFAYLCMAVILRRQWVDNEKLSFPLVQLPLEMIRGEESPGGSFLKSKITWMGFAIPALLFGFNGLHQWYPSVPDVAVDIDLNQFLDHAPWNGATYFHIFISFAAIGFFYLLPTDLLFSLWFFFLFGKAEEIGAAALGYQPPIMPMYGCREFVGYQIIGCYIVLSGYMLYTAWPHLKRVWRAAVGRSNEEQPDEILSYRTACFGLIAALLLAAGWMTLIGMSYWLALFELVVLLFVVALVMARSTCEAGMLMTETSFRPIDIYRMFGDVRNLGGANMTGLAFLDALWMRDQRGLVLTGFLDSMKAADGVRVSRRSLAGVFSIAMVVAILVAGYLHISLPYHRGAVNLYGYVYQANPVWAFNDAATTLNGSRTPLEFYAKVNFGIGVLVTFLITTLRTRLVWFPLHPLAYALSGSWTVMVFWFPCFVAWMFKVLILRYGGMRGYVLARPFFLGMVLGEFTMGVLWTIPSIFYNTPTPFFPWP